MIGTGLFFLVIAVASLPLVPAWLWMRARGLNFLYFLVCLGTGFISVIIALAIQAVFPVSKGSFRDDIVYIFVRIALTEEFSRLVILFPVLSFINRRKSTGNSAPRGGEAGLIAGLGFAAAESVFYAAADPRIALFRAFTAAPLHGACGERIGSSLSVIRRQPPRAAFLFLSAVLIHGMYDFFILNPAFPSFLSLLIALVGLGASLISINHEDS